jgi:hypothetical protein
MGEQESRYAYFVENPSLVEQCSPNALASTIPDSPNVVMGEQESR